MEANFAPVTGMDRVVVFTVSQDTTMWLTSPAIRKQDRKSAEKTGTGRTVVQTVLLRTVIGLVITTVINSMAANSAIATGTEIVVLSFAFLAMTPTGITRAIKLTVAKFVWTTGLELSAKRTAKQ